MCGIAGLVGDFVPGLIDQMNAAQAHRGPDGTGAFESPRSQVALGHSRADVTQIYAERDLSKGVEVARRIG